MATGNIFLFAWKYIYLRKGSTVAILSHHLFLMSGLVSPKFSFSIQYFCNVLILNVLHVGNMFPFNESGLASRKWNKLHVSSNQMEEIHYSSLLSIIVDHQTVKNSWRMILTYWNNFHLRPRETSLYFGGQATQVTVLMTLWTWLKEVI